MASSHATSSSAPAQPTEEDMTQAQRRTHLHRIKPGAKVTLMRYLQDLNEAETPASPITPKFHTGRLPNSKAADGKPRLLLMGQRRYVSSEEF